MRKFVLIFLVFLIFCFMALNVLAAEKSFNGYVQTIKKLLENGKYQKLTDKYLAANISTGEWYYHYFVLSKNKAKDFYLKLYVFKSKEAKVMEKDEAEIYFPEIKASKYGIVIAKLLNKKTKTVYKGKDKTAQVELFQIVRQENQVKILGIYKSTLKAVFYMF